MNTDFGTQYVKKPASFIIKKKIYFLKISKFSVRTNDRLDGISSDQLPFKLLVTAFDAGGLKTTTVCVYFLCEIIFE